MKANLYRDTALSSRAPSRFAPMEKRPVFRLPAIGLSSSPLIATEVTNVGSGYKSSTSHGWYSMRRVAQRPHFDIISFSDTKRNYRNVWSWAASLPGVSCSFLGAGAPRRTQGKQRLPDIGFDRHKSRAFLAGYWPLSGSLLHGAKVIPGYQARPRFSRVRAFTNYSAGHRIASTIKNSLNWNISHSTEVKKPFSRLWVWLFWMNPYWIMIEVVLFFF